MQIFLVNIWIAQFFQYIFRMLIQIRVNLKLVEENKGYQLQQFYLEICIFVLYNCIWLNVLNKFRNVLCWFFLFWINFTNLVYMFIRTNIPCDFVCLVQWSCIVFNWFVIKYIDFNDENVSQFKICWSSF